MALTQTREPSAGEHPPPPAPPRLRREFPTRFVVVTVAVLLLGYLALTPVFFLIKETLTGPKGTWGGFKDAYGAGAGTLILNSLIFALGTALFALIIGTVFAYIFVRTNAPFKRLLFAMSLVPLVIPAVLYAVAWILLASPSSGAFNQFTNGIGLGRPFDIYSMPGMILVQGLHISPVAFLIMVAAFKSSDPALEESALTCGARWWQVIGRVTAPLTRAAALAAFLIVFVQALESFEVAGTIGLQAHIFVFTSRIYFATTQFPVNYAMAGALALGLMVIALVGLLLSRALGRQGASITGKSFRPREVALGKARPFVGAGLLVYFFLLVVLPLLVLFMASIQPFYHGISLSNLTFSHYDDVFHLPAAATALKNSLIVGAGSATLVVALCSVVSWFLARTNSRARALVDAVSFVPIVVPGLVLGLGLTFVYLRVNLPIYGTLWIVLIAFVTRFIPFGMRFSLVAMAQPSKELEESAYVSGATWAQSLRRILLPLTSQGLLGAWIFVFVISFRELSAAVILYSPGREVAGVLLWEQFESGSFGNLSAIGCIMVVVLLVVVTVASRIGGRFDISPS
jgi:iron(III) transport system permease protein